MIATVLDVAPVITARAATGARPGAAFPVTVDVVDPGQDPITGWRITWGDGSPVETLDGALRAFSHVFAANGRYTIQIEAVTGAGVFTANPLTVLVSDTQSVPLAVADAFSIDEDSPTILPILANDSDADGDAFDWVILTGPRLGTIERTSAGALLYRPNANAFGADSFLYQAVDGFGASAPVEVALTIRPVNDAPVLAPVADVTVAEGGSVSLTLTGTDIDDAPSRLRYLLLDGPAGAVVDLVSGAFAWNAPDGPATHDVRVGVRDEGGLIGEQRFRISVADVAPSYALSGASTVRAGAQYRLDITVTDPGRDTVQSWLVNWGDGSPVETLAGDLRRFEHIFAVAGPVSIAITLVNEDGSFIVPPFALDVLAPPVDTTLLRVTSATGRADAIQVAFSEVVNTASITFGTAGSSVVLRNAAGDLMTGRLGRDPQRQGFTLVPDPVLPAGTYTLEVAGIETPDGRLLDGDSNGVAGGTFTTQFVVRAGQTLPVAVNDQALTQVGTPVIIDVLGNDFDPDGGVLDLIVSSLPRNGRLELLPTRVLVYTPFIGFSGVDRFEYRVTSGGRISAPATVEIQVAEASVEGGGISAGGPADVEIAPVRTLAFQSVQFASTSLSFASLVTTVGGRSGGSSGGGTLGGGGDNLCRVWSTAQNDAVVVQAPAMTRTGTRVDLAILPKANSPLAVLGYTIDWGDGQPPVQLARTETSAPHVYKAAGVYTIKIVIITETGPVELTVEVTIEDRPGLMVDQASFGRGGLAIRLTRMLAPGLTVADLVKHVELIHTVLGPVATTLGIDADRKGLTITPAQGGAFPAGPYTLRLRSGLDAFHDTFGCDLDGNRDGRPGDDYLTTFEIEPERQARATPARPDVPTQVPLVIEGAQGLTALLLRVGFDPGVMTIKAVSGGRDLPAGSSVTHQPAADGSGHLVAVNTPVPLGEGRLHLVDLDASLKASVPPGTRSSIDVELFDLAPKAPAKAAAMPGQPVDVSVVGNGVAATGPVTVPAGGGAVVLPLTVEPGRATVSLAVDPDRFDVETVRVNDAAMTVDLVEEQPGRLVLGIAHDGATPGDLTIELRARPADGAASIRIDVEHRSTPKADAALEAAPASPLAVDLGVVVGLMAIGRTTPERATNAWRSGFVGDGPEGERVHDPNKSLRIPTRNR
jgi:PKD repeat protein